MEMKKTSLNMLSSMAIYVDNWFTFLGDKTIATISIVAGVIWSILTKYLIQDVTFLPWMLVLIGTDTIAGWRAASKKHRDDPINNPRPSGAVLREKLGGKLLSTMTIIAMLNGLTHFEVNGVEIQLAFTDISLAGMTFDLNVFNSIWSAGCISLMGLEARSTIRNVNEAGGKFANSKINEWLNKITGNDGV